MIDYDKLDELMELPVSEEMLGAYIEGNLADAELLQIKNLLHDSSCEEICSEVKCNDMISDEGEFVSTLCDIELPNIDNYFDVEIDDSIIKNFTTMENVLFSPLAESAEGCGSVGAHMRVGEDAVDVSSSHVLQSYADTCAIKSQQLILEKFGIHRTEDELVQQAYDNGWYRPGRGTTVADMGEILNANGVSCTNYEEGNIAQVVNALADGKQIIMGVDSGELWETSSFRKLWEKIEDKLPLVGGADHALLVTGVDASDPSDVKVIVTDPGSGDLNKPYPLKQFIDAAEDSKFFMTVTDEPAPNVFDAFAPGTTHLPMIGDMNYYEFKNQFGDYLQDGDVIPDSVWDDFKLSAFGAGTVDIIPEDVEINDDVKEVDDQVETEIADDDEDNTIDDQEDENDHQQDEYEDDDHRDSEDEDPEGDDEDCDVNNDDDNDNDDDSIDDNEEPEDIEDI